MNSGQMHNAKRKDPLLFLCFPSFMFQFHYPI